MGHMHERVSFPCAAHRLCEAQSDTEETVSVITTSPDNLFSYFSDEYIESRIANAEFIQLFSLFDSLEKPVDLVFSSWSGNYFVSCFAEGERMVVSVVKRNKDGRREEFRVIKSQHSHSGIESFETSGSIQLMRDVLYDPFLQNQFQAVYPQHSESKTAKEQPIFKGDVLRKLTALAEGVLSFDPFFQAEIELAGEPHLVTIQKSTDGKSELYISSKSALDAREYDKSVLPATVTVRSQKLELRVLSESAEFFEGNTHSTKEEKITEWLQVHFADLVSAMGQVLETDPELHEKLVAEKKYWPTVAALLGPTAYLRSLTSVVGELEDGEAITDTYDEVYPMSAAEQQLLQEMKHLLRNEAEIIVSRSKYTLIGRTTTQGVNFQLIFKDEQPADLSALEIEGVNSSDGLEWIQFALSLKDPNQKDHPPFWGVVRVWPKNGKRGFQQKVSSAVVAEFLGPLSY